MNAIFVDYKVNDEWQFAKILESTKFENWSVIECQTNHYHGSIIDKFKRFFWYFVFPLRMIFLRGNFERIIAWQQFYGLNFAFWSRLFHLRKVNDLTVMTFIYKKKNGFLGKIYHKYMCFIVKSKYIDRFICFSKEESEYYPSLFGVDKERFVFIPVGISPIINVPQRDDGYIFATGRSNRDYIFLMSVFNKTTTYKCKIACDTLTCNSTENVTILNNCHGTEMIELMAHCHCVAIPLKDTTISSGQLVILQAMALGKPVICTDADGIRDYTSAETTIMVPNSIEKWINAFGILYNEKDRYEIMCKVSKKTFEERFTNKAMFSNIAKIVYNIV